MALLILLSLVWVLSLAKRKGVGYTHTLQVLHSDKRKRITLPDPARPRDSWIPEVVGPNQILLTRVEKPRRPRARLVRKRGLWLLFGALVKPDFKLSAAVR